MNTFIVLQCSLSELLKFFTCLAVQMNYKLMYYKRSTVLYLNNIKINFILDTYTYVGNTGSIYDYVKNILPKGVTIEVSCAKKTCISVYTV